MCDEANMESLGIEDYADSREFAWVMEVPYIHRTLGLVNKDSPVRDLSSYFTQDRA